MSVDSSIFLSSIQSRSFRTTTVADAALSAMAMRFGFTKRYIMARLAIGVSLSEPSQPPAVPGDPGKAITGEDLFGIGEELVTWVSLVVAHSNVANPMTAAAFAQLVERHWARGQVMLSSLITPSTAPQRELELLFRALAERTKPLHEIDTHHGREHSSTKPLTTAKSVIVALGPRSVDLATSQRIVWQWSRSQLQHVGVLGQSGSGKTEFVVGLLQQLSEQAAPPIIFIDPQGQIARDKPELVKAIGATVVEVKDSSIPLNLLHVPPGEDVQQISERFCASFSATLGSSLGAIQRPLFLTALERLLKKDGAALQELTAALHGVYEERSRKPDGLCGKVEVLNRRALFGGNLAASDFFSRSWVLSLQNATEDRMRLSMLLLLDAMQSWSNSLRAAAIDSDGNREIRCVLVIDEARRLLQLRSESLLRLLREARQKGVVVVLMSQDAGDFETEDADFLSNMGLVAAFVCQSNPSRTLKNHLADSKLNSLPLGHARVRFAGDPVVKTVQVWDKK